LPFAKKRLVKYFSPTFAKTLHNASETQIERTLLVVVFYFYSGVTGCYFYALAMANANHSICTYFICAGNGYCVKHIFLAAALLQINLPFFIPDFIVTGTIRFLEVFNGDR